jgi:uncharacterized protein (TIGR02145 family)
MKAIIPFSIFFLGLSFSSVAQSEYCGPGTHWDELLQLCVVTNGSDSNFDGCIYLDDLLALLSGFGGCVAPAPSYDCSYILFDDHLYETVVIGEQRWFAENLRSENFNNGDAIGTFLNYSETPIASTSVFGEGGYCNNLNTSYEISCDPSWSLTEYGRLYNWYAVTDERGLCPSGWHVATLAEWVELADFLVSNVSTEELTTLALMTTSGWPEGVNGTDEFGFSALPGGYSSQTGNSWYAGTQGMFWTSTIKDGEQAYMRYIEAEPWLFLDGGDAGATGHDFRENLSVRCILD